jgi:type VI secretion system protein ImpK
MAGNPNDPFADHGEPERTVMRPSPGQGFGNVPRPAAPAQPAWTPPPAPAAAPLAAMAAQSRSAADAAEIATSSSNPLVALAAPLLGLVSRLRHMAGGVDLAAVRERVHGELKGYADAGRNAGVPAEPLRAAHYALAATVDDVVMNTPWGAHGGWSRQTMVSAFHGDVQGGERFFMWLDRLLGAPAQSRQALELFELCMALGMEGKYRLSPRGPAELAAVRDNLRATLRGLGGSPERELSGEWQGVNAPKKKVDGGVPVWVVGAAALLLSGIAYGFYTFALASRAEAVEARMGGLAPPTPIRLPVVARPTPPPPPPPPRPPPDTVKIRVERILQPDIAARRVQVDNFGRGVKVTINFGNMFALGSSDITPELRDLLGRIGASMRNERGVVNVTGHTDNQPIRTVRFPSNQALSEERAKTAAAALAPSLGDAARIQSRGLADSAPIADNATQEGRARNRRIEITLVPPAE